MLVNVRGTNGSGKTYISHKLILDHKHEELVEPTVVLGKNFKKSNCFAIEGGLYSVGRWKSGLDGIFPQEIVEELIKYWAPRGNIVWENVLVSANIGRWAVLAKELEPINHSVWAFMDTPLQTCINRVFSRRAEAAAAGFSHRQNDADVKLDVIAGHWRRVRRAAARAYKEGIDVRWIDHTVGYEQIHDMLVAEGSWDQPEIRGDAPYLKQWTPTPSELELVLKTARLPWEPDDTVTKVEGVERPAFATGTVKRTLTAKQIKTPAPNTIFDLPISRWGGEVEEIEENVSMQVANEEFNIPVRSWLAESSINLTKEI